jgi:phosphohistidine phosphatase
MKRQLFIIRHGKSSWDNEGLDDIDRPLAPRGIRGAKLMAGRLKDTGMIPGLIYSSPASRALNTALIMQGEWGLDPSQLEIHDDLYTGYLSEISGVVGQAPDEAVSLAIFGHNPSFTMYANTFLKVPLDNLPTAGVVVLTFKCDSWKEIGRENVVASYVDYPKR